MILTALQYMAAPNAPFKLEFLFEFLLPLLFILLLATFLYIVVLGVGYYTRVAYFKDLWYEFSYWGLLATTAFSGSIPWRTFLGYKERPRFFFLYLSRYRVIAIPKWVFDSPETLDTFRSVLREALPYYKKRA